MKKSLKNRCISFLAAMLGIFLSFAVLTNASAQENTGESIWGRDYLLGDWGSARTDLEEKGFSFELVYTGEIFGNLSGGLETGKKYMANIDLTLTVDTEKAGWWGGGTFFVYSLNNHGGDFSGELVGDLQTVSNIEAGDHWRLYEIWYEQNLFDGAFSILLGQHDLNSEFDVTEYGGLFLDSSFGIEPDISANVPVSIFPVATPAVRVKLLPNEAFYIQAAVYDGDPGDQDLNNNGLEFRLTSDEGFMSIYEMGYSIAQNSLPGTYKLGGWYHTKKFDDVSATDAAGDPVQRSGNYGIYFLADQMVWSEQDGSNQGLGLFVQIGGAPDDRNTVDFYIGGGLNYHGLCPNRDEDDFGIAVAHASISDKMVDAGAGTLESAETTLEITYLANITPWFSVQPDFQYIINPSADPALKNATVAGLRFGIVF